MIANLRIKADIIDEFKKNNFLIEGLHKSECPNLKVEVKLSGDEQEKWIGIPRGSTGIQAFYNILENIIRNAIKHNADEINKKKEEKADWKFVLEIALNSISSKYCQLEICDNIEKEESEINELIEKDIKPKLEEGVIDAKGELLPSAWGLKEMVICAASLIGRPIDEIQKPIQNKLFEPFFYKTGNCAKGSLGYRFRIFKPFLAIVICDNELLPDKNEELENMGIKVTDSIPDDVPYPLMVIQKKFQEKFEKKYEDNPGAYPIKYMFSERSGIEKLLANPQEKLLEYEKKFCTDFIGSDFHFILCSSDSLDEKLFKLSSNKNNYTLVSDFDIDEFYDTVRERNSSFKIILDHHVLWLDSTDKTEVEKLRTFLDENSDSTFYENYTGVSRTFSMLANPSGNNLYNNILFWDIQLAGFMKVLILDERIQEKVSKQKWPLQTDEDKNMRIILKYMRIYIPDLNKVNLQVPHEEKLENFLSTCGDEIRPHILVIHSGILDKIGKKEPGDVKNWVDQIKEKLSCLKKVVVNSGRGVPSNLPSSIAYIALSSLENGLFSFDMKSKFYLVQELLAARRRKK